MIQERCVCTALCTVFRLYPAVLARDMDVRSFVVDKYRHIAQHLRFTAQTEHGIRNGGSILGLHSHGLSRKKSYLGELQPDCDAFRFPGRGMGRRQHNRFQLAANVSWFFINIRGLWLYYKIIGTIFQPATESVILGSSASCACCSMWARISCSLAMFGKKHTTIFGPREGSGARETHSSRGRKAGVSMTQHKKRRVEEINRRTGRKPCF